MKATIKKEKFYCYDCDEPLTLDKKGHMTNKDGTESVARYICEQCDQSYAIIDGLLHYAPYTATGKRISVSCIKCEHTEEYRQKMVYLCEDGAFYKAYCVPCAIDFLRIHFESGKPENITEKSVRDVGDLYSTMQVNALLQDPVRYRKLMESKEMQDSLKELGLDEQTIKARLDDMEKEK